MCKAHVERMCLFWKMKSNYIHTRLLTFLLCGHINVSSNTN